MAEELKLTISSIMDQDYKICLSKFFCMTFFDKRGKQLEVFFATVFGGYTSNPEKSLPSSYKSANPARLSFDFSDSSIITDFKSQDITKSFLDQGKDNFSKFWGELQEYSRQSDVTAAFKNIYGVEANEPTQLPIGSGEQDKNKRFYQIGADKEGRLLPCLVTPGIHSDNSGALEKQWGFTLQSEKNDQTNGKNIQYNGIQFINWTRCTISLSRNILKRPLTFSIQIKNVFSTPDFTWYFAPPVDYEVREPKLRIGEKAPFEPNKVMPVSDRTTVLFKEWVNLQIDDRIKSRVVIDKNINIEDISVELNLKEASGLAATRQFFSGLIIAFLLSYFADQTRVNDIVAKFALCQLLRTIIPIILPVMIGLGAINCLLRLKRKERDDKNNEKSRFCREFGFWSTIVVAMLYIFVPIFAKTVSTAGIVFFFSLLALSIISNGIYLFCYERILKRSLRDIL